MKKIKILSILFIIIIFFPISIYGFDYTTGTVTDNNCGIFAGYSLSNLNDGLARDGFFTSDWAYSSACIVGGYWQIKFNDNYTFDRVSIWNMSDGSGSENSYTINVSIGNEEGETIVLENYFFNDSGNDPDLVHITINESFTPVIGDYIRLYRSSSADDSWSGMFVSELQPYAVTSIEPIIEVFSPQTNTRNNSFPLDFFINVTDDSNNNMTCLLRNESQIFNNSDIEQNIRSVLTFGFGSSEINQNFTFNITCFDNEIINSSTTVILNITIDTIEPVITINNPLNNTRYDKVIQNISYNALCTDQQLLYFNMSLINKNNGLLAFSVQNNSAVGTEMSLKNEIDLSSITPGEYNLNFTCVDPHTATSSKIFNYTFNRSGEEITFYGIRDAEIVIGLSYSELPLCDYGAYSLWDREVFWYDFYSCNLHIPADGKIAYRWKVKDKNNNLRYIEQSPFKGHFVTNDHYITFHTENPENDYVITDIIPGYKQRVRIRSEDRYFLFDHSVGGLNKDKKFLNINITENLYTPLKHIDFNINPVIFDSPIYIPILSKSFNLSKPSDIILSTSMNIEKFTHPSQTEVFIQYEIDEVIISEQEIITLTGLNDIKSVNVPFVTSSLSSGNHNLTISVLDTQQGSVLIDNTHLHLITNQTDNGEVNNFVEPFETSFSSTSFTSIKSWNVLKSQTNNLLKELPVYIEASISFFSVLGDTAHCRINDGNDLSPAFDRTLGALEIGSSGISWVSNSSENNLTLDLECYTEGGNTITANGSMLNIVLGHNGSNDQSKYNINYAQDSLEETSSFSGIEEILSIPNIEILSGVGFAYTSTAIIETTSGTHTPFIFINTSTFLTSGHDRTLTTGGIGTVKFYTDVSNSSISDVITSSLSTDITIGESFDLYNASLTMIEISVLNTSESNIPPINIILSPNDGDRVFGNTFINYSVSDLNQDSFLSNITISNSSNTFIIETNTLNTSTFSIIHFK